MIYDSIDNFANYSGIAPEAWKAIAKFLASATADMPTGANDLGNGVRALVSKYRPHEINADKLEIHRNFADIQLLLSGRESIIYRSIEGLETTVEYVPADDYALYRMPDAGVPLELVPGKFSVFLPNEGHMPGIGCACSEVVKVVIKVPASAFVKAK